MSGSDFTVNETAAGVPPAHGTSRRGTPLVLQVSPLPGSPGVNEFYYGAFGNVESGDFAPARAFFIHQGHTVVFHNCPDAMAFQALYPLALIRYISSLPDFLINEGHLILQPNDSTMIVFRVPLSKRCTRARTIGKIFVSIEVRE